jgi:hypothetical protein
MAAGPSIDVPGWLEEQLALASPAVASGIAASRVDVCRVPAAGTQRARG